MPEYVHTAPYPLNYTEGRDAKGANLGLVEPGEIRDLDKPPAGSEQHWAEAADDDRTRWAAIQAAREAPEPDAEAGDESSGDDARDDAPVVSEGDAGDGKDSPPPPGPETPETAPQTPEPGF